MTPSQAIESLFIIRKELLKLMKFRNEHLQDLIYVLLEVSARAIKQLENLEKETK